MTLPDDFKGYIHDVGGPTANFYHRACKKQEKYGACKNKQCLFPKPCENLVIDHHSYLELLRKLRKLPGVKKVFVRSGIRFDYMLYDKDDTFFRELCEHHISGQLKVAPEHISNNVLSYLGKPDISVYNSFCDKYAKINKELGYIKIKSFGETTYAELLSSLAELETEGFRGLVIDLRGNGGGYLNAAIQMINEFLPKNRLIVYTQGRRVKKEEYYSNGQGSYEDIPLIVLTDEFSASAAEIFSGAIQDNDRGVIIGRRTFGKGLVQQPIDFTDGSMLRLTVARYYTPSGRCIQKPYVKGHSRDEYDMDLITRYEHGEFFNEDSIHQSGEKYFTRIGRVVYGGGGIMPDFFVAEDTTKITAYYAEVNSKGLIAQFCFEYADGNRKAMSKMETADEIIHYLRKQMIMDKFIRFCDSKGVKRRNNMILTSQHLLERAVYSGIVYYMLDMNEYIEYLNRDDPTVLKAIEVFKKGEYRPVAPTGIASSKKKK